MKYFIIESDLFQEQFEGGYFYEQQRRKQRKQQRTRTNHNRTLGSGNPEAGAGKIKGEERQHYQPDCRSSHNRYRNGNYQLPE